MLDTSRKKVLVAASGHLLLRVAPSANICNVNMDRIIDQKDNCHRYIKLADRIMAANMKRNRKLDPLSNSSFPSLVLFICHNYF